MIYTMVQMYNFSSNERDIYFVRFISPSAVINVEPIFCKPLDISVWTQFSDTQCTEDIKVLRNINLFKLLKNLIQMRNHEVSQYFAVYLLSNLRRWSYIHLGESAAEDQHLDDPISPGCHDQVSNLSGTSHDNGLDTRTAVHHVSCHRISQLEAWILSKKTNEIHLQNFCTFGMCLEMSHVTGPGYLI